MYAFAEHAAGARGGGAEGWRHRCRGEANRVMSSFHGRAIAGGPGGAARTRAVPLDPSYCRDYLGGVGMATRLLWEHSRPGRGPVRPGQPAGLRHRRPDRHDGSHGEQVRHRHQVAPHGIHRRLPLLRRLATGAEAGGLRRDGRDRGGGLAHLPVHRRRPGALPQGRQRSGDGRAGRPRRDPPGAGRRLGVGGVRSAPPGSGWSGTPA